jgi:hypothetical protein
MLSDLRKYHFGRNRRFTRLLPVFSSPELCFLWPDLSCWVTRVMDSRRGSVLDIARTTPRGQTLDELLTLRARQL